MINSKKLDSLSKLHNSYKVSNYNTSNKNVSSETSTNKPIKDTVVLSTSVEVNNDARISEVKQKIENNEYKIDTDLIAKAIIADFSLLK